MRDYSKYIDKVQKDKEFRHEQERLHEKHEGIEKDTVIIEKSNMFKFTIGMMTAILKTTCLILILIFATIGIFSLCYPNVRVELLKSILEIINQIGW